MKIYIFIEQNFFPDIYVPYIYIYMYIYILSINIKMSIISLNVINQN